MPWEYQRPDEEFFTADQKRQVEALFRRLLPSDAKRGVPGADEADAATFLSYLLAMDGATYYEIPTWRRRYPEWLSALDTSSRTRFDKPIVDLSDDECNELLAELETGALDLPDDVDQSVVFRTLWRHCLQGCFSDPRWGGNRDGIMWRWYGHLRDPEEVELGGGDD